MSAALDTSGLSVGWPGHARVLTGLDLRLAPGERIGLVGPNGAGKSTLFATLAGLIPPLAGQISVMGDPLPPATISARIGVLLQHSEDQLFCPTLAEDVRFGPQNQGLRGDALDARVTCALAQCDLSHLADRPVHHLSGGEKRRAAIAGLLAMQPEILLLDEPSAALDLRSRRALMGLLARMPQAMVIASHDLDMLLDLCPRILLVDAGRVQADGPAQDVLSDAALMQRHGQEVPASLRATGPVSPVAIGQRG